MKLARRKVLKLGAASLAAAALAGCGNWERKFIAGSLPANALPPASARTTSPAVRLLNRAAFGPGPGDVAMVTAMGLAAYVDQQLHPEKIDEPRKITWGVRRLGDSLDADAGLLFDQDDRRIVESLREATLLRAVYSKRQLFERTVAFWSDHFNIYVYKGQGAQFKVLDDKNTIRPHAFGRFRDLLGASARSAAMLGYLDNTVNVRGLPNENYAREVMELHTLGVNGGYTQRDVQELARCLTGWTVQRHWHRGQFTFDSGQHDNGAKHVLGLTIAAGGGVSDAERVLDHLASHPATARHLSTKLCNYFLGEAPEHLVRELSGIYLQTNGDIRSVLRPLLLSPDMLTAPPILKRPFDYLASACRAFNVDTDGGPAVQKHLDSMGQSLFAWPRPDGFPQGTHAWSGALLPRWNFALGLTKDAISGTSIDWTELGAIGPKAGKSAPDGLLEMAFGCSANDPQLAALRKGNIGGTDLREYAGYLIMSPHFQWK